MRTQGFDGFGNGFFVLHPLCPGPNAASLSFFRIRHIIVVIIIIIVDICIIPFFIIIIKIVIKWCIVIIVSITPIVRILSPTTTSATKNGFVSPDTTRKTLRNFVKVEGGHQFCYRRHGLFRRIGGVGIQIIPVQWTNVEVVTHLKDNSSQLSRIDIVDDLTQCRVESGMIIECHSHLCLRTDDEVTVDFVLFLIVT